MARSKKRERERKLVAQRDRQLRRRFDQPVIEGLADFALVICERCGLEQANAGDVQRAIAARLGVPCGCFLCGHVYARTSPHHAEALASLVLFSG